MAASNNRATKITKLHSALKKVYKPIPQPDRPLMELLLYACLLEDAPYEAADESMARLEQDYFDWNEVRVTTITEIAETLRGIPDPTAAAIRLKKNLHALFELHYRFDIEELKKQNLGKTVEALEKLPSMTPFVLAYVIQHGLGGHQIAVDRAGMRLLELCDIVTSSEAEKGKATGLDRAIAKAKGPEFTSILHQAAVALLLQPTSKEAWTIIKSVNPAAEIPAQKSKTAATPPRKKGASAAEEDKKRTAGDASKSPGKKEPPKASKKELGNSKSEKPKADASKKKAAGDSKKKSSDAGAKKPAAAKQLTRRKPK